jgi:phosphoribosylglycinamide formyltransferase-1
MYWIEKTNVKRIRLAILASGGGSNAKKICTYFNVHDWIEVATIITNKADAGVLDVADEFSVPSLVIKKENLSDGLVAHWLYKHKVDFIVLAGFLMLIPAELISNFPNRILNIHPSLLPKYGGKGMHGHHVHAAVILHHDHITGMTIHLVNEKYDEGQILFQAQCKVDADDNAEIVAKKVLVLEHKYYSVTIENYIKTYLEGNETN